MSDKEHVPLPKNTKAFICADCGVVALDANNICKVMGQGVKSAWCGIQGSKPPSFCRSNKNNNRWQCENCGQISVNPELLCKPLKMNKQD